MPPCPDLSAVLVHGVHLALAQVHGAHLLGPHPLPRLPRARHLLPGTEPGPRPAHLDTRYYSHLSKIFSPDPVSAGLLHDEAEGARPLVPALAPPHAPVILTHTGLQRGK